MKEVPSPQKKFWKNQKFHTKGEKNITFCVEYIYADFVFSAPFLSAQVNAAASVCLCHRTGLIFGKFTFCLYFSGKLWYTG